MAPDFAVYTAYLGAISKYELTFFYPEVFNFHYIIIDIRDQYDHRISFEYGTLTLTLYFR